MIRTLTEALVLAALLVGAWWVLSNKDADMRRLSVEASALADSLTQKRRELATLLRQRDSLALEAAHQDTVRILGKTSYTTLRDSILPDTAATALELRAVIAKGDTAIAACEEFASTCKMQVITLERALAKQDSIGGFAALLAENRIQGAERQVKKLKLITASSVVVAILAVIFR